MAKRSRAAILPTNIILLQNLVKRDPESYREEFLQQYAHYQSLRDIFMLNSVNNESNDESAMTEFMGAIGFVAQVCSCYPRETANFPNELKQLVLDHHKSLPFEVKEKIITSLTMLRNKKVITPETLIQTMFPLLIAYSSHSNSMVQNSHAKELRTLIYSTLVQLMKSCNTSGKNQKLNKSTHALCFNLLEQPDSQGIWASKLTRELWRRGIWDDSRSVEIMSQAALHNDVKIAYSGVLFFLDADKEREEAFEENDDEDEIDTTALKHKLQINKKSSKRGKKLEQAIKTVKKKNAKGVQQNGFLNFSAIHLLRDPQGFAEKLFERHLSGKNSNRFDFEQKIAIMQLLSRLTGTHKLIVLGFYSYFLKYLTPKQRDVTKILSAAAQSCHDQVPPETIEVIVRKIANEFVSDGVSNEVATVGLNTVREILTRAPLAIDETLLQDLTEYKGSKAKSVAIAAKGLISLYREVAPEMLRRKDRGKTASMGLQEDKRSGRESKRVKFGVETTNVEGIDGIELLAKWKREHASEEGEDEAAWDMKNEDDISDASDVDGDWVTIESDKEYEVDMDSDDDDNKKNNKKKSASHKGKKRSREEAEIEEEDKEEEVSEENDDEDSDLDLSDDEKAKQKLQEETKEEESAPIDPEEAFRELTSNRILTPADFAKLQELRTEKGVTKLMGITNEETIDHYKLMGPAKHKKQNKEERMASIKEGREDREKFGSKRGKRDSVARSTTNREKSRKKNFVMMIHKRSVKGKQKMSLRDRQKVLRAHITKQKKKGN
ncbi:unnamed protein product [Kluyveromyces dobzhanskii CBS 2104]|uniref:Protein SDA1 n=1 Tax=Kluyveromyces dobzhanskii CBS 2104 TaxID=1427455 RepID=A0A0A8LD45_9SACH|nr:unnamed protein product [Kluyveromyces dobzhanskii CBS 2104]